MILDFSKPKHSTLRGDEPQMDDKPRQGTVIFINGLGRDLMPSGISTDAYGPLWAANKPRPLT